MLTKRKRCYMTHGSLALKLRVLRAERALTIEQAADRAGVQPETISDAERGRRRPYLPTLRKLAAAYEVPVEELLSVDEEPALAPLGEAPGGAEDDYEAPEVTDDEISSALRGVRKSAKHPEAVNVIESLEVTAEHVEYVLKRGRYDLEEIWHLVGTARAVYADYRARRKRLLESLRDSAPRLHELLQQADARMKSARDAAIGAYDARRAAEQDKTRVAEIDELEKMRERRRENREDRAQRSA